jgi:hypothetical protein
LYVPAGQYLMLTVVARSCPMGEALAAGQPSPLMAVRADRGKGPGWASWPGDDGEDVIVEGGSPDRSGKMSEAPPTVMSCDRYRDH